jgi:Ca2+ transporting ATPase
MTMALSVLVIIELLNALNSVSEDQSLLAMPPWKNMYLIAADMLSLALHFVILYVPFLANLFQLEALNGDEWKAVVLLSIPVIFIDELLKFMARHIYPTQKVKFE